MVHADPAFGVDADADIQRGRAGRGVRQVDGRGTRPLVSRPAARAGIRIGTRIGRAGESYGHAFLLESRQQLPDGVVTDAVTDTVFTVALFTGVPDDDGRR